MDWEKAKTILIIIFAVLNASLFAMNSYIGKSYKMTPEEVSAIAEILYENGIILDCELPSDNRPLRFMSVTAADWEYEYIRQAFFPDEKDITRIYEEGSIIYKSESGGETVAVTNAFSNGVSRLTYSSPDGSGAPEEYKSLLDGRLNGLELQRVINNGGAEIYVYNEAPKNGLIFASSVEVAFFPDGSVTVTAVKYDFDSYIEPPREIFRADEALLTFMHYKTEKLEGSIAVENIQLGYSVDGTGPEKTRKAKICYRIFIEDIYEPVYIDAVMNTVLEIKD